MAVLDSTEKDVRAELETRLANIVGRDFGSVTNSRLNVLANAIRKIRADGFDQVSDMWSADMQALAQAEADFLDTSLQDVSPVQVDTVLPDSTQLASIADSQPMQGRTLGDWAAGIAATDLSNIMDTIRIGMVQGQTTDQIVRSVLGTGAMNGADGVVETTRRNAASVTQTAIATVSGEARQSYIDANSDIFDMEMYVAVLDSRTTPQCRALDGQTFKVGEGPQPPIHWNCRSTRVPIINGKAIGNRPAVSATEDQLDGLSRSERAAAVQKMVGQVPASTNYNDWLARQTNAFQDDVLGPTRAALFRDGNLTLDRFVSRQGAGDEYTIDQLRQREPEAFKRAGLGE